MNHIFFRYKLRQGTELEKRHILLKLEEDNKVCIYNVYNFYTNGSLVFHTTSIGQTLVGLRFYANSKNVHLKVLVKCSNEL